MKILSSSHSQEIMIMNCYYVIEHFKHIPAACCLCQDSPASSYYSNIVNICTALVQITHNLCVTGDIFQPSANLWHI